MTRPVYLGGLSVVMYDGDNTEAVLEALDVKIGDGIVTFPDGHGVVVKSSALDKLRRDWASLAVMDGTP